MSSIIANEFVVEASPASLHLPAIIGVGLVLLGIRNMHQHSGARASNSHAQSKGRCN